MAGGLAKLQLTLEIDGDKAVITGLNNVEQAVDRTANTTKGATGRMADDMENAKSAIGRMGDEWNRLSKVAAAAFAAFSLGAFVKESIDAALAIDRLNRMYRAATGDANLAGREMEYVKGVVKRLGLDMLTTAESYGKFMAASKGTTIEGEKARKVFESVSGAATALGLTTDATNGIFIALTQMMSKGTVQSEELRGQLGERLPRAFQLAADAMGLTTAELGKQLELGKITGEVLLPRLAVELDKTYGKAAVEGARSAAAEINRMNTAMLESKSTLGSALMPTFTSLMTNVLTPLIGMLGTFIKMLQQGAASAAFMANQLAVGLGGIFTGKAFTGSGYAAMSASSKENEAIYAAAQAAIWTQASASSYTAAELANQALNKSLTGLGGKDDKKAKDDADEKRTAAGLNLEKEMLAAMQKAHDNYNKWLIDEAEFTEKEQLEAMKAARSAYYDYQSQLYQLEIRDEKKVKDAKLEAIAAAKKASEEYYKWQVAHDPMTGALAALKEYSDFAKEVGTQTGQLVTNMFYEMEDAFTSFLRTGKLDFKNFIDSLLDDLARMAVKQGITGPLSSMLGNLMSGTAATYLPQTAAGSAGLLDGTSAGGLSSLMGGMQSAVAAGAQSGTATGASTGVASGMAAFGPYFAAAAGVYLVAADLFKPGGVWNQSGGNQRTQQALLYSNPFGWAAAGLNQFTGGGLLGTKWRSTASGLQLGVSAGEIEALNYQDSAKKKSFYRGTSRRTDYTDVDSQLQDYLNSSYNDVLASIRVQSATLGNRISEEAIKGFTTATTKINLAGLDGEAQQQALADYFRSVSNEALALLVPDIASQIRLGEDATAAYARLNALKLTNNALLMRELELLGQGSGSKYQELLNTQREAELLGVDASTAAIQRRIWALEDEQKIMEEANATRQASLTAEMELARKAADSWHTVSEQIRSAIPHLLSTGLSPEASLAALRGQFASSVTAFRGGDLTQANSITSLAQQMQEASRSYYASGSGFQSDNAAIIATLDSLALFADNQSTNYTNTELALREQVDQLASVDSSLKTVVSVLTTSTSSLDSRLKAIVDRLDGIESKTSLAASAPLSAAA